MVTSLTKSYANTRLIPGIAGLTTVSDCEAVFHTPGRPDVPPRALRFAGLKPDTEYTFGTTRFRTLKRPPGELLSVFATVNDLHFGEKECGRINIKGINLGVPLALSDIRKTHPELMNEAAVREIQRTDPQAVIAKGDLTDSGRPEEFQQFFNCYRSAFGQNLYAIPGNHDVIRGGEVPVRGPVEIVIPGLRILCLDTAVPRRIGGQVDKEQLCWLEEHAASSDRPVVILAHHAVWNRPTAMLHGPGFLLDRDDSMKLVQIVSHHKSIVGFFSGHTHRNRVIRRNRLPVPFGEVGSVKEWPGNWAEYRVYEGGIQQITHRISEPEALAWSERTKREMYSRLRGLHVPYGMGRLQDRCFVFGLRKALVSFRPS